MLSVIIIMSILFPSPNGDAAQLGERLLSMNEEALGLVPSTTNMGMASAACNPIPGLEAGGSGV